LKKQFALTFAAAFGLILLWLSTSDPSVQPGLGGGPARVVDNIVDAGRHWPVLTRAWLALILVIAGLCLERLLQRRLQSKSTSDSGWMAKVAQFVGVAIVAAATTTFAVETVRENRSPDPVRARSVFDTEKKIEPDVVPTTDTNGTRAATYFALTPAGVRYSDRAGVDKQSGVAFEPVTPGVARNLERSSADTHGPRRIPPPQLRETAYVDAATRESRLWYAVNPRNELEAFDGPGRHPAYGTPLRPVTPAVANQLEQTGGLDETGIIDNAVAAPPLHAERPVAAANVAPSAPVASGKRDSSIGTSDTLVLAYSSSGYIDRTATAVLADALHADDGVLRRALDDNAFHAALAGDTGRFGGNTTAAAAGLIVLARVTRTESAIGAERSVTVLIRARVFRPQARFASTPLAVTSTRSTATSANPASEALFEAVEALRDRVRP
jgi:hypothetical protein